MSPENKSPQRRFTDLLKRLANVPKRELDEREQQYQLERGALKHHHPKKSKRS